MSEHILPDDFSQWPRDPYALLGVEHGVDERGLKKAYTRLIRQFKPERAPDQFRRIRDAYELLRERVRWQNAAAEQGLGDLPDPLPFSFGDGNDETYELVFGSGRADRENGQGQTQQAVPKELAQLRAAYQQARDGKIAAAYQSLCALNDSAACNEEYYARMYWMLRLWPQLQPLRHPCQWLAHGMEAEGLSGRLSELYREHLESEPAEALTARCQRLLTQQGSDWSRLELVRARWRAAARLDRLEALGEDLERLRPLYEESYQAWVRVLLAAIDVLHWSHDPHAAALMAQCRGELEQFPELSLELADELDRFDLLEELVDSCRRLQQSSQVPPELVALVRDTWLCSYGELRPRLQAMLAPLVASLPNGLWQFDLIRTISPAALTRLGELIERLFGETEWEQEPMSDEQGHGLRRIVRAHGANDYDTLRIRLLLWCTSEMVSPDQAAEFLRIHAADAVLHTMLEDASLHYLWMAHVAMWAY